MAQGDEWEKEYRNPKLITNSDEPQLDFKHFVKWLRKERKVDLDGLRILDLGSGTGKNSLFLADRGSNVIGIDISSTAMNLAKERASERGLTAEFRQGSIGKKFPFPDVNFDLILDVVSSNSLTESERKICISESLRTLKPGGFMFVKALCRDGDKNAENLLEKYPGQEKNTYVMPGINISERVFSESEFRDQYKNFEILRLENKLSYTKFEGKAYKRHFWLAYLNKN